MDERVPTMTTKNRIKRALFNVDGTNDFADYEATAEHPASKLPVPGGRKIGPVIGRLQREGKRRRLYARQIGIRDTHRKNMFNFAEVCGLPGYTSTIADRDGVATPVYPLHMIPNTWGWQWIEGTESALFDRTFQKGKDIDKDQFSGALPHVIKYLKREGITHVDLVGLVLRICVGLTAIDLAQAGFKVRVIVDATQDLDIPAQQAVLDRMKELGVELTTSDQVLAA